MYNLRFPEIWGRGLASISAGPVMGISPSVRLIFFTR